jgi:hypothetical protein
MKKVEMLFVESVPDLARQLGGLLQTGVKITDIYPVTSEQIAEGGKLKITVVVERVESRKRGGGPHDAL